MFSFKAEVKCRVKKHDRKAEEKEWSGLKIQIGTIWDRAQTKPDILPEALQILI